jgi:hypothetical protein
MTEYAVGSSGTYVLIGGAGRRKLFESSPHTSFRKLATRVVSLTSRDRLAFDDTLAVDDWGVMRIISYA